AKEYRNCQFMTPETRRTTHFFWNYLHNYELHDPTIAISLRDSMLEGFMEDKAIIEAQQQVLDADPNFKMLALTADVPLSHFRRTLNKLIAEEQGEMATAA
ncbi:MAG TPA: aromatic ring-hydroxylating dioxygenase subunit alpha, partial [Burkholderiaceae bacterium]|nr:aromatic ring-hydroxylating dioxygenase subunit alpha [Burkholderiaceae bacterium]